MDDEFSRQDIEAPFNMALATLKRLDTILQQLRQISVFNMGKLERQRMTIDLLKQFFINAIPLLDETYVSDNKENILSLKTNSKSYTKSGNQKNGEFYDGELDKDINIYFIELQQKLKKYFMPKGKDPGKAIEFN